MTQELTTKIAKLADNYPERSASLLAALYLAQREFGWLNPEAMEFVAESLGIPKATVKGVATFYVMYRHKPMGKHLIQVCTNVSCMLFGSEKLVEILSDRYGLVPGGTSMDGRFSLLVMECIGACDTAPAMLVDTDLHGNVDVHNLHEILERYK